MKAAVFHGPQKPLTIENVDIAKPIGREVLVRTVASGVCHSDLHFVDGYYQFPAPAILGHEAAGIVEEVGPHVTEFKPGDHVIACLSVFCGHCSYCLTGRTHLCQSRPVRTPQEPPKLSWNGAPVNQFANLSAYAEKMLVHENAIVKMDDQMPFAQAALIGCGVTTGVGAVLNTARIEPGTTVAPASTRAVLSTAPTPVVTPQPINAPRSSGMSSRTLTSPFSWTSIFSA